MSKVISISTDRNIFEQGSAVWQRQVQYGALFEEMHIIVFTKAFAKLPAKLQIAPNVWVYGTRSLTKFTYMRGAVALAMKIISASNYSADNTVITVQNPFETGLVGLKLKKKTGLPLHVQIHTDFMSPFFAKESFLNRMRVKMAMKVLPQADAVRAVSKKSVEKIPVGILKPGVTPHILPIFVDAEKFEKPAIATDLRAKYPQFNFIILMASRLTVEKNISLALRVFKKVLGTYGYTGLVIVGSGPEKTKLEAQVKQLNIGQNVKFEEWQNDLTSYYKTAHTFLLTSNYEGYGLTLIEAVASHCPAVSTDVGIASEILRDGISLVCPVGDEDCLAKTISHLIEDIGVRENAVHEAAERLDKVVIRDKQKYLELYKESINGALKKLATQG